MKINIKNKYNKNYKVILILAFLASFLLILPWVLISFIAQSSLIEYLPSATDEVGYWQSTSALILSGSNYGWKTINEIEAFFSWTRLGVHSPFIHYYWALYGKIFGWEYYSIVYANIVAIIASSFFIILTNKNHLDKALLSVTLILLSPLFIQYLLTSMQEVMHISIGMLAGGLMSVWLKTKNRSIYLVSILILVIATFIRPTWGFTLAIFCFLDHRGNIRPLKFWLLGFITPLISLILLIPFKSPFPNGNSIFNQLLVNNVNSFTNLFYKLWNNFLTQAEWFYLAATGNHRIWYIELNVIYLCILISIWATSTVALFYLRNEEGGIYKLRLCIISGLSLIVLTLIILATYNIGSGFRVIIPHALVLIPILINFMSRKYCIAVTLILITPIFIFHQPIYNNIKNLRHVKTMPIKVTDLMILRNEFQSVITKSAHPWCNTVALHGNYKRSRFQLAIPPSLNVTYLTVKNGLPKKSKYFLSENGLKTDKAFKLLKSNVAGSLWLNTGSKCD